MTTEVFAWLAYWSANDQVEISLNAWNQCLQVFIERLCVYFGAFNTEPNHLKLCLSCISWLCRTSKASRGESFGPPQVFPEHAHSPTQVCSLLDPQEFVRACQNPYGSFISLLFFLSFMVSLLCPNYYPLHLLPMMLNNYYLLFQQTPSGKRLSHWVSSESGQIRTSLVSEVFQRNIRQVKWWQLYGLRALKEL